MNRFKFRIWDKQNNIWVTDKAWIRAGSTGLGWYGMFRPLEFILSSEPLTHYVVQQWTGLIDSEGKDVYEGDIVLSSSASSSLEQTWTVEYYEKYAYFGFKYVDNGIGWCLGPETPKSTSSFRSNQGLPFFKVVGNVFENPEYLK